MIVKSTDVGGRPSDSPRLRIGNEILKALRFFVK